MAKFRDQKTSFVAGEISPTALGRVDLPQYRHACRLMKNLIPIPSGGCYRRPGTLYHSKLDDLTSYAPRILPFKVSETVSYLLIMRKDVGGNGTIEGYYPTGNISVTGDPPHTAISCTGTFPYAASTSYLYDEWQIVQYAQSVDVMTLVHPRYKPMRIYRTAVATFNIAEFDTTTAGVQLTGTDFRDAWPYLNQNTTATTLAINTATVGTGRTLTASASLFTSAHLGSVWKVDDGAGSVGCALITQVLGPTTATVTVKVAFGDTAAHATWWESAWSDERGWPRSIAYFQGRLVYGGSTPVVAGITRSSPDSIWHTEAFDYNQLSHASLIKTDTAGDGSTTGPTGSNAFTSVLSSQQLNAIQWLSSEKTLVVGTESDEWIIDKADQTVAYGANNRSAVISSHFGSSYSQPVRAGNELIFSYQSDHELKALTFNLLQDAYSDEPLQLLYDEFPYTECFHTFGNRRFRCFSWDGTRKILWCVDTAGFLRGLTRDKVLQVNAWHSHEFGGTDSSRSSSGNTNVFDPIYNARAGSVVSMCVLPNPYMGVDDVWVVVKRFINNGYHYHIERMIGEGFPSYTAYQTNVSAGLYLTDGSAGTLIESPASAPFICEGLGHLRGETPVGTAYTGKTGSTNAADTSNGIFYATAATAVDSSGEIELATTYPTGLGTTMDAWIVMGLNYESIIEPVRPEIGSQIGTAQGAIKRIHEISVRFYRTLRAKVGRDSATARAINFREPDLAMGLSAELFTGDKKQKFPGTYDRDGYVYIICDRPLPFAVLSISTEGVTSDG